jgi:hypothetical protein
MALELRPNCEGCDRDLLPDDEFAMICTYECTFCRECVERLHDTCPNCGGNFATRPIRPASEWRPGLSLGKRPASTLRTHMTYSWDAAEAFAAKVAGIAPRNR